MSESNLDRYRERERHWRDEAFRFSPGYDRDACFAVADGYARLIEILTRGDSEVPRGHAAVAVERNAAESDKRNAWRVP
jgi:hypothetical protein